MFTNYKITVRTCTGSSRLSINHSYSASVTVLMVSLKFAGSQDLATRQHLNLKGGNKELDINYGGRKKEKTHTS